MEEIYQREKESIADKLNQDRTKLKFEYEDQINRMEEMHLEEIN